MFDMMPVQASEWAGRVDWINKVITDISVICTLGITAVMIYVAYKYRHREGNRQGAYITHNATVETVWTVIPSIICLAVFAYGFVVYHEMRTPPANPIEISVEGYKWGWRFAYANGKRTAGELTVPIGKPVRLVMTSADVIHSFFIPAMRVKEDLYKANYSYIWFTPTKLGEFHIFCTEYCGTSHSAMTGKLKVVSPEAFEDFLLDRKDADAPQLPPAEIGKSLFSGNGCTACHSIDGSSGQGPTLKGLFSGKEHKMADGSSVVVDENYVRESIVNPRAKIVEGYPAALMPSFAHLKEEELNALIAYLKEL